MVGMCEDWRALSTYLLLLCVPSATVSAIVHIVKGGDDTNFSGGSRLGSMGKLQSAQVQTSGIILSNRVLNRVLRGFCRDNKRVSQDSG